MLAPEQLHVIRCYDRLPPMPGGMERHIAELTAAQRRQGVRVTEIYNSGEPGGEAVQVWRGRRLDRLRPSPIRWALYFGAAAASRIDFSDGRIPVLHVHGDWVAFLLARMLELRIRPSATAASLHGVPLTRPSVSLVALRRFDVLFTTGLRECRELSSALNMPVIHLPSAPADAFFSPIAQRARPIDVIAVGSLVAVKRLELLLACAALRPRLSFAIVGDGRERQHLEQLRNQLELNNVQFLGAVTAADVPSVLSDARLFINTSSSEGSPTAALEAMACGLPAVLTPSNDFSAIIDQGVNGWATQGDDPAELVKAIDWFLDDPDRLASAAHAARRTAEAHRWDDKARIVTGALIAAVERRGGE